VLKRDVELQLTVKSFVCEKYLDILQGVNCLPNLEELFASSNRLQRVDSLAKCKKVLLMFKFYR